MRSLKLFGFVLIIMSLPTMVFAQQMPVFNTSNVFSGNYGASWLFEYNQETICVGYVIGPVRQFYVAKLNQNGDTISVVYTPYQQGLVNNNNPWEADIMPDGDIIISASEQIAGGAGNLRVRLTRLEQNGNVVFDTIYSNGINGLYLDAYSVLMKIVDNEIFLFGTGGGQHFTVKLDEFGDYITSMSISNIHTSDVSYDGDHFYLASISNSSADLSVIRQDPVNLSTISSSVVSAGAYNGLISWKEDTLAVLDYVSVYFLDKNTFASLGSSVFIPQDIIITDFESLGSQGNSFLILGFKYDSVNAKTTNVIALNQGGVFYQNSFPVGSDDYPLEILSTSWGIVAAGLASGNNLFTLSFSTTTSVLEIKDKQKFSVYPNPSNGEFILDFETGEIEYEIFNQIGALVQKGTVKNLNSIYLEIPGVYFLRTSLGLSEAKKLIVH